MTNGSQDDDRSGKSAPRFDQAQPNQSQQKQGGGGSQQQGGFPHEDGGWGHAEQDLLRDQQQTDARESGENKAHQRQARPTGI